MSILFNSFSFVVRTELANLELNIRSQIKRLRIFCLKFFNTLIGWPKVIFFDFGDTLVHFKSEVYENWAREILRYHGIAPADWASVEASAQDLKQAIRQEWAARVSEDLNWVQSEASEQVYWRLFYAAILARMNIVDECAELVDMMAQQAADPNSFACFSNVWDTLCELRARGLELGIISNAFPSAEKILWHLRLLPAFQYVIFSYEKPCACQETFAKPFPGIYNHALRCARVKPKRAVFVDDRASFVTGAQDIGMRAVLLDRDDVITNWTQVKIHDLEELLTLKMLKGASELKSRRNSFNWPDTCIVAR